MRAPLLLLVLSTTAATAWAQAEPVTLGASDGLAISGEFRPAAKAGSHKPVIVLFHQSGSNRHEYDPIAPRLNALGFPTLAIDQRRGGGMWNQNNETAARYGQKAGYLETLPDLEAALVWAVEKGRQPAILWGSSYSATLVFKLAAEHQKDIAAILAFSPGEYFQDGHYARTAAAQVHCPVFVTSQPDKDEVAKAKEVAEAVASTRKTWFVPQHGDHGSSTLRDDRNPKGTAETWKAVQQFLATVGS